MLNFKIKKRANQPESEEVHEVGKHQAQILAVWGSPGCGKTTVSVKIAKHLAEEKCNSCAVRYDFTHDALYLSNGRVRKHMVPWQCTGSATCYKRAYRRKLYCPQKNKVSGNAWHVKRGK